MAYWFFALFAVVGGVALAIQSGVNSTLGKYLPHPVYAVAISFAIGTAVALVYAAAARAGMPDLAALSKAPWWVWTGGVLGVVYVMGTVVVAPRLGAAALMGLLMGGLLVTSLVLDHFGLVGLPIKEVNAVRITGAALLVVGAVLIQRT
ncbi:DMT family transporter [Rubrobacter aplysinae]|uniref:DMT family transporter n=1 Tax=Rubrobacter aplysinae TaxID=909625 RepID=UPI00064C2840|nr:DMT family transporter [Rubrobacter aplysinae]